MITHSTIIATPQRSAILEAAVTAARRIPPAFPLEATVAVNPFLGHIEDDLAEAAARLARVGGVRATLQRAHFAKRIALGDIAEEDLAAALEASPHTAKPASTDVLKAMLAEPSPAAKALSTVADLAATATGTDWPALLHRTVGLWAGGRFDRGQALWTLPERQGAFASWRAWATHDLTPELAGLNGFAAHVAACPDTSERAILRAAETLGIDEQSAETAFHRLLLDMGGWAQHARWLLWKAELDGGSDETLIDLLAVRLVWEEALFGHCGPAIASAWADTLAEHAAPLQPTPDQVADAVLQDAAERAHQRRLTRELEAAAEQTEGLCAAGATPPRSSAARPTLQAAFCIDVRSEVFRRALEAQSSGIETIGFAGFFGLPLSHKPWASDLEEHRLPVLLKPSLDTTVSQDDGDARIAARARRAWGRFRQAAVSSFAFVEAAGPLYAAKLLRDALGRGSPTREVEAAPALALSAGQRADIAASVLGAMSMTEGFGRLVLLLGHGASVTNNPHESAYHCGACGGHPGDISARVLAQLLNDEVVRVALSARGVHVPADTWFVGGLHDTTTDAITLFAEGAPASHEADLAQARAWLLSAGAVARAERAPRLPGAAPGTVAARALNWAEVRPEWGLAGCAAFIAAPRRATLATNLGGRAFLHSYDWRADREFGTLELILTAPVVVASWIGLQYYGSVVAPETFGSGNKLIHNVIGGMGVVEGNGGRLRAGLPWQAVHDGSELAHEPLRLSVLVEAPREAIGGILARNDAVRTLFDRGWLHLLALENGRVVARYRPGLQWESAASTRLQQAA